MTELSPLIQDRFLHTDGQLFSQQICENGNQNYPTLDIPKSDIPAHLAEHLSGSRTLSICPMQSVTNLVKWAAIDFDLEGEQTLPHLEEIVQRARAAFKVHGIDTYLEFSGGRGFHLWMFFASPLPAATARKAIKAVCDSIGFEPEEIFPEGDVLTAEDKGRGRKTLKLPFGTHQKSGRSTYFLPEEVTWDHEGYPENTMDQGTFLESIVLNDPRVVAAVSEKQASQQSAKLSHTNPFQSLQAGKHPPCIEHLHQHGAPLDLEYNKANLSLASYCLARNLSDSAALDLATQMATTTAPQHPTSKKTIQEKVSNFRGVWRSVMESHDTYQWSCGYIRQSKDLVRRGGCQGWDCPFSEHRSPDVCPTETALSISRETDVIDFLLAKPEIAGKVALQVAPSKDGFLNPTNRTIWDLAASSWDDGKEFRKSILLANLDRLEIDPAAKERIVTRLDQPLPAEVCNDETFREHLVEINKVGLKVQLTRSLASARKELEAGSAPIESTLDMVVANAERLWARSAMEIRSVDHSLKEILDELLYDHPPTIETFSPRLNDLLNGGFGQGKLTVIGSPPGGGKTTFTSQQADFAAKSGVPVLYVSYEMGKSQLVTYALSRAGRINSGDLESRRWKELKGDSGKRFQDQLGTAITDYQENVAPRVTIVEANLATTVSVIKGMVRKVRLEAGIKENEPVLVVIDYLQLMPCGEDKIDQGANETVRVSRVATQLKQLARDTKAAVLAISDINKAAYEEATKSGQLNMGALRDSFKIAHAADQVCLLQSSPVREKVGEKTVERDQLDLYRRDLPDNSKLKIKIDRYTKDHLPNPSINAGYARLSLFKNRGGRQGNIIFVYERAYHHFEPLDFGPEGDVMTAAEEFDVLF